MSSTTTAILRRYALLEHNPRVREYFRDVTDPETDDITTSRALVKRACLVDDKDTIVIIQFKMWLFNDYINRPDSDVYGIPIARFHSESNEFKPQCLLYFEGNKEDEGDDGGIMTSEISFRLFWDESEITTGRLKNFARDIKNIFATPRYTWRRGTEIISYYVPRDGFELKLYAASKTEGTKVIRDVVRLAGKTFDESLINRSESNRTFPVNPGTEIVLGKSQKKIRRRPIGTVAFEYAQFSWYKLKKPIILVNSGRRFRRTVDYI